MTGSARRRLVVEFDDADDAAYSSSSHPLGAAAASPSDRRSRSRSSVIALLATVGATAAVLAVLQVTLPWMAEKRIEGSLDTSGDVTTNVDAVPAIKLLLGHADHVGLRADEIRTDGSGDLGQTLARVASVDELDVAIARLRGPRTLLRDVSVVKRGDSLRASAALRIADVAPALDRSFGPLSATFRPTDAGEDEIRFRAATELGRLRGSARGSLRARDGKLVIALAGLEDLTSVTVFSHPALHVEAIGSRRLASEQFRITVRGRLTAAAR